MNSFFIDSVDEELEEDTLIFNIILKTMQNIHVRPKGTLDIPIVFTPKELRKYEVNLVVSARREARMSWIEPESRYIHYRCVFVNQLSPFIIDLI